MSAKVTQRRTVIKKYMENHAGEWVSSQVLADRFNVGRATIQMDIKLAAKELGGVLEACPSRGYMYNASAKPEVSLKNYEGYNDPTASIAIAKVDGPEVDTCKQPSKNEPSLPKIPGEIWECSTSNGGVDLILIIKAYSDFSLVLKLVPTTDMIAGDCLVIVKGCKYDIDTRKISTKPNKYITRYAQVIPEDVWRKVEQRLERTFIAEDTRNAFDMAIAKAAARNAELTARIKELESKIEEKKDDGVEVLLLKTKVEIYERLLFGKEIES